MNKLTLILPNVKLNKTKENYVFRASGNWNNLLECVFEMCASQRNGTGIIIPGSNKNSDLTTSIGFVKSKLKEHLLNNQKCGDRFIWQ